MRAITARLSLCLAVFAECLLWAPIAPKAQDPAQGKSAEQPSDQAAAAAPSDAGSQSGAKPDKPFLNINHLFGIQYEPLGVFYEIDPFFRWDFFPGTDNILLKDAHIAAGLTGFVSPAVAYYGPSLTVAPLTIFRVNVQFTHTISGVMGDKTGLLDYGANADPEIDANLGQFGDYSYEFRSKNGDELGSVTTDIWTLFIKPAVFLQFGPIVFGYLGRYMYYHPMSYEGLYYNDLADIILSHESWCLMNDFLLFYEIGNLKNDGYGLMLGVSTQMTFVIDDGNATELTNAERYKIGPALTWTITDEWWNSLVEKPSIVFEGDFYLKDPIADDAKRIVHLFLVFSFATNWYL